MEENMKKCLTQKLLRVSFKFKENPFEYETDEKTKK